MKFWIKQYPELTEEEIQLGLDFAEYFNHNDAN